MGVLNGSLGVDLFFALSGFLITYLSVKEAQTPGGFRLGAFWVRRAFRIVPLAWTYTAIFLVVAVAGWHNAPLPRSNIISASFLFYVNYLLAGGKVPFLLGHLWTLGMEMQFYFLWAVVLKLVRPSFIPAAALAGILLVILCRSTAWHTGPGWDGLRLESRGDSLLWGALFGAILAKETGQWIRRWLPAWCFLPCFLLLGYVADQHPIAYATWQPFLCAIVVTVTVLHASEAPFRWMESAPLRLLGRISFSIYIWQQMFTEGGASHSTMVGKIFLAPPWSLLWIVPLAWLSYRWIELPGMRLGVRLTRPRARDAG
jgi:peptidoglycan/LPS O-acetylase OafA/YrhL